MEDPLFAALGLHRSNQVTHLAFVLFTLFALLGPLSCSRQPTLPALLIWRKCTRSDALSPLWALTPL